jgi:putative copper resistance protein D
VGAAIDSAVALVRAAVFFASLQAAGAALFLLLFEPWLGAVAVRIRSIVRVAGIAALMLVALRAALEPARMAGSFAGFIDPFLQTLFWSSNVGTAQLVRAAGLVLLVASAGSRYRRARAIWIAGVVLVVASFAFMGHTRAADGRALGGLLVVHLGAVAFWYGALLPLWLMLRDAPYEDVHGVLLAFSRLAIATVPLLLVAGAVIAWQLLGSFAALTTPYGTLLLVQCLGFAVLVGLAAVNRLRLTPAMVAGKSGASAALRATIAVEVGVMVVIFTATAWMTTLYSPE